MQITELLLTNKTARPGTKITPKALVIHWTANESKGADAIANRNYFNNPTTEASAHYIVDDKQIIRCLPETEMGYHVGAKMYKQDALTKLSSYPNNCTIGIEMCVNAGADFKAMYQRTVELAADILKRYGWNTTNLWRHYDITGKTCPAFFVSDDKAAKYLNLSAAQAWQQFINDVHKILTGNPQPTVDNSCKLQLNGKTMHTIAHLTDGTAYIPVRDFTRELGHDDWLDWCDCHRRIVLKNVYLQSTKLVNGTGLAATREIAGILKLDVDWDAQNKVVKLKGEL